MTDNTFSRDTYSTDGAFVTRVESREDRYLAWLASEAKKLAESLEK